MTRRIIQISFLFLLLNLAGGVKSLAMPANGLTYTQDVLPVRCTGTNSGAIADTVRGGVPPYGLYCTKDGVNFFTGTVYDSIAQIIALDTGTYQVTIYDADHGYCNGYRCCYRANTYYSRIAFNQRHYLRTT